MKENFTPRQLTIITMTLILGSIVVNSALDMNIPILPDIAKDLFADESIVQLTVSASFYGSAAAGLIYGPIADVAGRKRILLGGLTIFLIASIWSYLALDIYNLIFARFFQGVGAVASSVIWLTIVNDIYKGRDVVKTISIFQTTISLSLAMAPIVGVQIANAFGWRAIFATLVLAAIVQLILVAINIPETLPADRRRRPRLHTILKNYKIIFSNPIFIKCGALNGIIMGTYLGFIAVASFYFMQELGLPKNLFVIHQFTPVLTYALAAWFNRQYVKKTSVESSLSFGIAMLGLHFIFYGLFAIVGHPNLITASFAMFSIASPFLTGPISTYAMELYPRMGGTCSSALTTLRQFFCALTISLFGFLYNGSFITIYLTQLLITALIIGLTTLLARKHQTIELPADTQKKAA